MDTVEIEDLFAAIGPVQIRRMFGGQGIYSRGRIVAIELRDEIMLKADAVSAPAFAAAGARQWVYEGKAGKVVPMPYWSIPDGALDDPDDMGRWARLACEAALRAPDKPARSRRPTGPSRPKARGPLKARIEGEDS